MKEHLGYTGDFSESASEALKTMQHAGDLQVIVMSIKSDVRLALGQNE